MLRRADALAVFAAIALLAGIALLRSAEDAPPVSLFSSFDTGRNGYRALYEVLGRERVEVLRYEYPLGLIGGKVRTLVLPPRSLGSFGGPFGRVSSDGSSVAEWTKKGGTLVVFSEALGAPDRRALGLPAKMTPAKKPRSIAGAGFPSDLTRGVRAVRGRFDAVFRTSKKVHARALLTTVDGAVAVAYHFGKGEVVAISDPTIFSNLLLPVADNARFAYNVLARGPVAFYERANGYAADRSFWDALPRSARIAVVCAAAIVLLGLIGSSIRFAPPLASQGAPERDSSAYIVSMARLLSRGRAAPRAIEDSAEAVARALRRRFGDGSRAPAAGLAARVGDSQTREDLFELERLRGIKNPSDAELIRAGKLGARLRKVFEIT